MKSLLFIVSFITLIAASMPAAAAEIYKCTDEHGNVAYLQVPCPAKKVEVVEDMTETSPEPQTPALQGPSSRGPDEPLEDCQKRYRDQIDEIDAEILAAYSPEKSAAHKDRLLTLTQQLRACG